MVSAGLVKPRWKQDYLIPSSAWYWWVIHSVRHLCDGGGSLSLSPLLSSLRASICLKHTPLISSEITSSQVRMYVWPAQCPSPYVSTPTGHGQSKTPHLPAFSQLLMRLLLIIHVGCLVFQKTSIIMYYQVGWVTPLSSMSALTGRAVWIMQLSRFSLSFSHVVLHVAHVDGCYSAPFREKKKRSSTPAVNCLVICILCCF